MIFPNVCVCCDGYLSHQEGAVCDLCYYTLPKFEEFNQKDSDLAKKFWGRLNVEFVSGYLRYKSGTDVRKILHQIKYRGNLDLGVEMGEALGRWLIKSKCFGTIDYIIPVPLHPKRLNIRGYN